MKKYICFTLACLTGCLVIGLYELPPERLRVSFLDVGQGDAILIQTPEGHNILIDGGPGSKVLEELSDTLPFLHRRIDFMVLTHPHSDHIEGLVEVLKRYEVGAVLLTLVNYNNYYYEEFLRDLDKALEDSAGSAASSSGSDFEIFVAEASEDFRIGSVYLDVLYPLESIASRDVDNLNNSSIVLRVSHLGEDGVWQSFLLPGDCERECEEEIISAGFDLDADVYKAGHHGSKTASSYDFVQAINPDIAVIQCGAKNKFGHPHAETLRTFKRLNVEQVLRNDLDGRITF